MSELGSMGKALLVHQHAMKLLKSRMQDFDFDTGHYRVAAEGVTVLGSSDLLAVYHADPTLPGKIYSWELTLGVVKVNYAPGGLEPALNALKRALVLDDLANI